MSGEFFFNDDEVEEIALSHIEKIRRLEQTEAQKVLRKYRSVREVLVKRLQSIPDGTFTQQKMRGTLLQVDMALKEMGQGLKEDFSSPAMDAANMGVEHLVKEIEKWNNRFSGAVIPLNVNAIAESVDPENFLFNQFPTSIQTYTEFMRARMANSLTQSMIAQDSLGEVVEGLGNTFGGEEWKLLQIARTELHGIYNKGKIRGMGELYGQGMGTIPDLKKTLFHPMDNRTGKDSKFLNRDNPIIPISEPFTYYWNGRQRTFMAPPDRPNDRAILIPYREEWRS